jgi:hypothetical protein
VSVTNPKVADGNQNQSVSVRHRVAGGEIATPSQRKRSVRRGGVAIATRNLMNAMLRVVEDGIGMTIVMIGVVVVIVTLSQSHVVVPAIQSHVAAGVIAILNLLHVVVDAMQTLQKMTAPVVVHAGNLISMMMLQKPRSIG